MQKVVKKKSKKKIQFLCPTSINTNLTLERFAIVMKLKLTHAKPSLTHTKINYKFRNKSKLYPTF